MSTNILKTYSARTCALVTDESYEELGQKNKTDEDYNRSRVHQRDLGHQSVDASLIRVEYGTWNSKPACLTVFKFRFNSGNTHLARFTKAQISIEFTSRGESRDPEVVNFGPKRLLGRKTTASVSWSFTGTLALQAGAGLVDVGPSASIGVARTYEKDYREVIKSFSWGDSKHEQPNWIKCFLKENQLQESGIPQELCYATIVTYESPFQATVDVGSTFLFDLFARPWTADDPVLFQEGMSYGPSIRVGAGTDFASLTREEWEKLVTTGLESSVQIHNGDNDIT